MITGNKGEWSEIFAFLKLLSEGRLYAADGDLNRIPGVFYPIIKILREEAKGKLEYIRNGEITVYEPNTRSILIKLPVFEFSDNAAFLLTTIGKNKGAFPVPETEEFMSKIYCEELKSRSIDKSDIMIKFHDIYTNLELTLGFSIKSMLGGASTLLNAGKTTNFVYRIKGGQLSAEEVERLNSISSKSKLRDRLQSLYSNNLYLDFTRVESKIFELNLKMIDSGLPEILAECLLIYYTTGLSNVAEIARELKIRNPLRFNPEYSHTFYEYKIDNFLADVALGMTPAHVWKGIYEATGGYIIIKKDGDIVCYHIYNRNELHEYLFNNTKFETASTDRYDFGKVYWENGQHFIKLNMQIRFLR